MQYSQTINSNYSTSNYGQSSQRSSSTLKNTGKQILQKNTLNITKLYVNPKVTKPAQLELAENLKAAVEMEAQLTEDFKKRPGRDRSASTKDDAKIFNDFCVGFINDSKNTRDKVSASISDANRRLKELNDLCSHLEEMQRINYRFEMNLPDPNLLPKNKQNISNQEKIKADESSEEVNT